MGFCALLFMLVPSCALLFPDHMAPKSSDYKIAPPPSPWSKLAVGKDPNSMESMKADLAFENARTGGIISLNSLCRKYDDTSLEALTNSLVRGIGRRELHEQTETKIDGAKALDSTFTGEVDQVKLKIRTVVVFKDSCTFDFIYVSIPKRDHDGDKAFDAFLASFHTD
jgi:hypothetical protein